MQKLVYVNKPAFLCTNESTSEQSNIAENPTIIENLTPPCAVTEKIQEIIENLTPQCTAVEEIKAVTKIEQMPTIEHTKKQKRHFELYNSSCESTCSLNEAKKSEKQNFTEMYAEKLTSKSINENQAKAGNIPPQYPFKSNDTQVHEPIQRNKIPAQNKKKGIDFVLIISIFAIAMAIGACTYYLIIR